MEAAEEARCSGVEVRPLALPLPEDASHGRLVRMQTPRDRSLLSRERSSYDRGLPSSFHACDPPARPGRHRPARRGAARHPDARARRGARARARGCDHEGRARLAGRSAAGDPLLRALRDRRRDRARTSTAWRVGDAVYALADFERDGVAADYAVVAAGLLAPKPQALSHVESAAVPLAALSAWQGLFDHGKLNAGERVLIHGAAGGVGSFAVQLARQRGAHVIGTASAAGVETVRELGADEVVDNTRHASRRPSTPSISSSTRPGASCSSAQPRSSAKAGGS